MVSEFGFSPRATDAGFDDYLDWLQSTPGAIA